MASSEIVVITGASSGIGEALALCYARQGARLYLTARRADELARVAGACTQAGAAEVIVEAADVTDSARMFALGQALVARWGAPDIVIANAGASRGMLSEIQEDHAVFKRLLEINVLGLAHTFAPFIEPMRAAKRGRMVGIASIAGFRGLPGHGGYSTSKAAAINYLESLRLEMRASGVKLVTICPGYIDTPLTRKNKHSMPFLMDAGKAAMQMQQAIARGSRWLVLPRPMAAIGFAMRHLPRWLYDQLAAKAPRKPRDFEV